MPAGVSDLVLTVGEAARALGIRENRVAAMVTAGELATVPVGGFGARFVPQTEVERIKATPPARAARAALL
jgi:hypothetical protein